MSLPRSRALLGLSLGACLAAVLAFAGPGGASTPTHGNLTTAAPTTQWTGGPFVVPNVTGTALSAPDCTAPSSCDDFALHVSTPAGYGATHQLRIAVSWSNTAADFDVLVLDPAGNVVGTSASSADPEVILLPPTSGDYTVRVVP